jgi:ubiquinone/menaquinone biosynthesis C-methylase UbiE
MSDAETILAEQKEYYRARAPEYDDWWFRRGRYDGGAEHTKAWKAEIAIVEAALAELLPVTSALELAAGTGNWTKPLAAGAERVTAVDASAEVIARNRQRLAATNVAYIEADLFQWRPDETYDLVFFGFWLSHIPGAALDEFWDMTATCLKPGGVAFFIDNAPAPNKTNLGQPQWGGERRITEGEEIVMRTLADGQNFRIVKNYFEPVRLSAQMAKRGWRSQIQYSGEFFIYGALHRND